MSLSQKTILRKLSRMTLTSAFICLQFALLFYLSLELRKIRSSMQKADEKAVSILKKNRILTHELLNSFQKAHDTFRLPALISSLPYADANGTLLAVSQIQIPEVEAPYNACLTTGTNCPYLLFFRADCTSPLEDTVSFRTKIGFVKLEESFKLFEKKINWINTKSDFSEDPRVIQSNGEYFLIYNDLLSSKKNASRGMFLANLDIEGNKTNYITCLDRKRQKTEKNWMPFFDKQGQINFVYSISPHEILTLKDSTKNILESAALPENQYQLSSSNWAKQWGIPRGGTPPCLIDGEFLTFFHSSFKDNRGTVWYVMGAYTFEAQSPYRITRISPYPILFKGIYEFPHLNTANPMVRCIYPAGLIYESKNGKELLHVSCGENDSCIKILTFDKTTLLQSLSPLSPSLK